MAQHKSEQLQANRLACADRAQKNFDLLGISENKVVDGETGAFFNHYSAKYARCLIQIETITFSNDGTSTAASDISDADERTEFGSSFQSAGMVNSCIMTPPDRPETACHSASEWSAYVKEMMTS